MSADQHSVGQILSDHMDRLANGRTFGQAVTEHVGEELPFLVRAAAGQAVKAIAQRWRDAGRPDDVVTLRRLLVDLNPQCTCDYAGLEGEPHKVFCELENGPHAECAARADVTESLGDELVAAAERVRLVNGALRGIDDLIEAANAWKAAR